MINTGKRDVIANRGTPFVHVIEFVGYDFSAATFKSTVRKTPDALGDPLISLTNASAGSEGISVTTATVDGAIVSTVTIRINETTIEGIYAPGSGVSAVGADVPLYWGLHVTSTGLGKVRWLEGAFIIHAGDQG